MAFLRKRLFIKSGSTRRLNDPTRQSIDRMLRRRHAGLTQHRALVLATEASPSKPLPHRGSKIFKTPNEADDCYVDFQVLDEMTETHLATDRQSQEEPTEAALNQAERRYRANLYRLEHMQAGRPSFYRDETGKRVASIRLTNPSVHGKSSVGGYTDPEVARVIGGLRDRLSSPMLLLGPDTIAAIDELAAKLHTEAPHMRALSQAVRESATQHVLNGAAWFQTTPIIVVGPPGSGKSHHARAIARLAGLPSKTLDGSTMTSPVPLIGFDGSWKNGRISEVAMLIVDSGVPNAVVILDEVDKIETLGSGSLGSFADALLALLEPTTARAFPDSYLRQPVDLSRINWIMTANDLSRISPTIRDRCKIIEVEAMNLDDLVAFVAREIERRGLDPEVLPKIMEPLRRGRSLSLRRIGRMLDAASAAISLPMLH